MKFKLDENIGRRGLELLRSAGHDVVTVRDEGLAGAPDEQILELGGRTSLEALLSRLRAMLAGLEIHPVAGRLWIIEPGRVRINLRSEDEGDAG